MANLVLTIGHSDLDPGKVNKKNTANSKPQSKTRSKTNFTITLNNLIFEEKKKGGRQRKKEENSRVYN